MSLDGAIVGPDGRSRSVSSDVDRELLGLLRRDADCILIGAGTARTEGYNRPRVPLVIVSRSMQGLAEIPALSDAPDDRPRPIVVTTESSDLGLRASIQSKADVLIAGSDVVDLPMALDALRARGLMRVHCEGGASLLGQLIEAELLDELYVTITPRLVGATSNHHLVDAPWPRMRDARFTSLATCQGNVFARVELR